MSQAFGGSKKQLQEFQDYVKKIGVFEAVPVAVNPDKEEIEKLIGRELEKEIEYLGTKDDVKTARITFYLEEVKNKEIFNVSFFLEDRYRTNKNEDNFQWINSHGQTTWAAQEDTLPEWFTNNKDVRKAKVGEEELYSFLRNWLQINFQDPDAVLMLDTKKLFKGNVRDLEDQIGANYGLVEDKSGKTYPATVCFLATVKTKDIDGEKKTFQVVNNKFFLPGYNVKNFQGKHYTAKDAKKIKDILTGIDKEAKKTIKPWQRFIAGVLDEEYPVKEFFGSTLTYLHNYDPEEDISGSDAVMQEETEDDDSSY